MKYFSIIMRQPSRKVGETYTCYEEKFII